MLIRCDHCSTLYELDEALLAPEGSPVQCTRCDHVFTARPPGGSSETSEDAAAAPEPAPQPPQERHLPPPPADEDDDVPGLPPSLPATAPSGAPRQPAPPQRWDRPGPPVYRPGGSTTSASPAVARPPQIRRDAVGAFEARLRRNARWRWLGPVLVLLVLAAVVAAWLLFSRRPGPVTERLRTEGLALVALDDGASLEQAVVRFDEALRDAPRRREAEADRALAQVLRATALLEDGEALAARAAAALAAEQAAALTAGGAEAANAPEGTAPAPAPAPAPSPQVARLQGEARSRTARGAELSGSARQALQKLEAEKVAVLEVARALAVQHAAAGEREAAQRQVAAGRARAAEDAWLALAEAMLDVRARDRPGREHGVAELSALAARHPELLRARYLLAAAQASLGRRAEAQATLDAILAANPRHERAEALRAELARPTQAAPSAAAASAPSGNGRTTGRNASSQPPTPRPATPPAGAPASSGTSAQATPRVERPGTSAGVPGGAGAADPGATVAPGGSAPGPSGAPAAARTASPRPRMRPLPEAHPVEFGAGR